MGGGNSHQRAVAKANKTKIVNEMSQSVAELLDKHYRTPWYKDGLFLSCVGIAVTITLAVIAAREWRWLLIFAWLTSAVALWVACSQLRFWWARTLLFFVLLASSGVAIFRLYNFIEPKSNVTEAVRREVNPLPTKPETQKLPPQDRKIAEMRYRAIINDRKT